MQLLGILFIWARLRGQQREVEKRDAIRAELTERHQREMHSAEADFVNGFATPPTILPEDWAPSAESAWITSTKHHQLQQRHNDEAAAAGVSAMTLGEVDELFARGPDAAVQFLVAQQLSGYGFQVAVVGTGTLLGVVASIISVYLLPVV